jgi:hypothetical protein
MFMICYKASQITSSASDIKPTDNSIITSKPYMSATPSLVPATLAPYETPKVSTRQEVTKTPSKNNNKSITNTKNNTTGSVSNTIAPKTSTKKTTNKPNIKL